MTKETCHILDPDGDVVLVLQNPCTPFAVWALSEEAGIQDLNARVTSATQLIYEEEMALANEVEASEQPVLSEEPLGVEPMPPPDKCQKNTLNGEQAEAIDTETSPIKFVLSSRHLILASRYFSAKLKGPWIEATVDSTNGQHPVQASEWDDQALLLLMRIIHGQNRKVPHKITLEMLAKIAVLVDYYDCHEAVDLVASIWIDSLKGCLPLQCNRDLILWLLISSVFRQPDIFLSATKTAIQESRAPLPPLELPISLNVISSIDHRRQEAIGSVVKGLKDLVSTLRKETPGCGSFECSSIMLGALLKQLGTHRLSQPRPKPPYLGYSLTTTLKSVRAFRSPEWAVPNVINSRWVQAHGCSLTNLIETVLGPIQSELEGLTLEDN
ncbi:hypothetical protein CT0861_08395 [Colletotrichum tofieldiae]|uniref:BTB domain-containing protein n=1 Tax=Colletotrichum tofieldiae TaxID=708197 RepID=A0A161VUS3_9PEZI|nr:hypothetical protein CT0861_08395 [Colletotrichum tofieldiae]